MLLVYLKMINRTWNLIKNINLFLTMGISEDQISTYYLNMAETSRVDKKKGAKIE